MKILQINSVCGYGSTGRIVTDIYKLLEKQGHECKIAYGRGNSPKGIKTIKIGSKVDTYTHVAKTRIFDEHGFGSIKATKDFIKEVKVYNPDVIHLHNIHGYYINVELLFNYLKELNIPVIWTLHDCWSFTGHCSNFDYICCAKWKTRCNNCPQKKIYPASLLIDNSKNNYIRKRNLFNGLLNMTIVTPSEWLSGIVKESFLKNYDVKVINNGIDLTIFKPVKSKFRYNHKLEKAFVILGIASVWNERKGLKYFIELSKIVDKNFRIVLVGLNDKQIKGLPKNIIGIKRTNNIQGLAEIYSSANVFINPTLEDNFPTTNLEALGCGIPVITFNTGGSVECINKDNGIIIEKGNLYSLKEAITRMYEEGFENNMCLESAKRYNKNDKYREYLKLYESSIF